MSQPASKRICVAIFAESRLTADSLSHFLQKEADLACSQMDSFSPKWLNQPEVILVDSRDATEATLKEVSAKLPDAKIIITNGDVPTLDVVICSRVGVTGFTLKSATTTEIAKTIRSVASGVPVIPQSIGARLYKEIREAQNSDRRFIFSDDPLTPREQDVARLAADGLRNKEIGAKLSLAIDTVKTHMRSILRKLALRNRVELVKLSELHKQPRRGAAA
jgi:DNA-binding NarL/FixJ family response regulator